MLPAGQLDKRPEKKHILPESRSETVRRTAGRLPEVGSDGLVRQTKEEKEPLTSAC